MRNATLTARQRKKYLKKVCARKKFFRTESNADKYINTLPWALQRTIRKYKCSNCNGWHMASKKPKRRKMQHAITGILNGN